MAWTGPWALRDMERFAVIIGLMKWLKITYLTPLQHLVTAQPSGSKAQHQGLAGAPVTGVNLP